MPTLVTFKVRGDTAANWATENPVLAAREIAVETDTRKMKIGDGTTAWSSLAYVVGGAGSYTDEQAQDAIGAMVDASLVYVDGTPLLTRAALTGDATAPQGSNAVTVVRVNGVALSGLGTGILKNTTGTGAPSIAVAADFPTLNQNTTGSAAKLTTLRTLSATGDVTWSGSFDGSANFSVTSTIAANAVTFTKMVAATAASIVGATAAGNFAQLTPAAAKGVLAIAVGDISGVDTDGTLSANSDSKIATQKATKTYVDQIIAAQDAMVFKGVIDCSANPNYPAADRGHTYRVSVAGKIGGASGTNVEVGDLLLCLTDGTAAGNQATVGASWTIAQTNLDGAVIGPASAADASVAGYSGTSGKLVKQLSSAEVRAAADFTSATSKATPVDADELPLVDSAASNVLKKLTWANLKATLKTYFDTLYQALNSNLTTIAGLTATTDNFLVSVSSAWASRTPAQVRTTLGLVIGTNVQAWDADLDAVATSGLAAAWTAYTPTITAGSGTFTTVSATGRYKQVGKIVFVEINITITTNGTAATGVFATLPVNAAAAQFFFAGREYQTAGKMLQGNIDGAGDPSHLYIVNYDNTYPGASGFKLVMGGVYEAA